MGEGYGGNPPPKKKFQRKGREVTPDPDNSGWKENLLL